VYNSQGGGGKKGKGHDPVDGGGKDFSNTKKLSYDGNRIHEERGTKTPRTKNILGKKKWLIGEVSTGGRRGKGEPFKKNSSVAQGGRSS